MKPFRKGRKPGPQAGLVVFRCDCGRPSAKQGRRQCNTSYSNGCARCLRLESQSTALRRCEGTARIESAIPEHILRLINAACERFLTSRGHPKICHYPPQKTRHE